MSPSHAHALTFDSDPYSVTNFVDRMHGECSPVQWLRELVVNSIEAIAATGEGGQIHVHSVEQYMDNIGEVRKLAITDTGEGIASNELYSSFQVAMTSRGRGNYGIGAKIAALPINSAGMIYRSKVEGEITAELTWHKTSRYAGGYYAAREWPDSRSSETGRVTEPSCDESSYSLIHDAGHGTQVVLCGENPEDDTCKTLSPSAAKSTGNLHWAIRQLNFKFWKIPKNIKIRVENAKKTKCDSDVKDYVVRGGEEGIGKCSVARGSVDLKNFPYRIRWFLLDKDVTRKRNAHNGWTEGRIVGTLYREKTGVIEVYAMRKGQRGATLMNDFGIYTGADSVVLLVEPTNQETMQPTTARNDLRVSDEGNISSLYKEIGQEFSVLMAEKAPKLAAFVKSQLDGLKTTSDQENLKEVIERAIELYKIKNYKELAKGKIKTAEGTETEEAAGISHGDSDGDGDPDTDIDPPEPDPVPLPPPTNPPKIRPRLILDSTGGRGANEVPPKVDPKTFTWEKLKWDKVTDYETNTQIHVKINTDGETYNRLLALYKSRPDFAEHPEVVEGIVKTKCEAALQLAIFTLEQEFNSRSSRLGIGFDEFFNRNQGRVSLDSMASKEIDVAIIREIKNLVSRKKSRAAAEARVDSPGGE